MSRLEAAALVAELRGLGVELVASADTLRFRPKSSLSPDLLSRLARAKCDVIDVLRGGLVSDAALGAGAAQRGADSRRAASRPNAVCLSCYGTRFVRLRNGRRSVCFGCEGPAPSEIEGEDSGVVGVAQ